MARIAHNRTAQKFKQKCQEGRQLRTVKMLLLATISEESPAGRVEPLVVVRQVGIKEKVFFGLGNRKAVGWRWSTLKFKHID